VLAGLIFNPRADNLNMKLGLKQIQAGPKLARQARWSVSVMAKQCGLSTGTLRRQFLRQMGMTPKAWLTEQRIRQAIELLRDGSSVKETAYCLGFKQQTNFTRQFKEHWGTCPSRQAS
jgi:methylphosphotriester-DNA--protein-cysteine methyltransferase